MYTVVEVMRRYGVGQNTVLLWISNGSLKAINIGRSSGAKRPRWRITQTAIEAFEASRTAATPSAPRTRSRRKRTGEVVQFY
jgi:hypothetical protein